MSNEPLSSDDFDGRFFHPLGASDCMSRIRRWHDEAAKRESALRALVMVVDAVRTEDESTVPGRLSHAEELRRAVAIAAAAAVPVEPLPEGDRLSRGHTPYVLPAYYHDWAEALESALSGLIVAAGHPNVADREFSAALAAAENALHPSITSDGVYISARDGGH